MISEFSIRKFSTYTLVISEFVLLILALSLRLSHGFDPSEFTTTIALISPVFVAHCSVAITHVISNRHKKPDHTVLVSGEFGVLSMVFWFVLVVLIGLAMVFKARNIGFSDFEEFKTVLLILEVILGSTVGKFVEALYA